MTFDAPDVPAPRSTTFRSVLRSRRPMLGTFIQLGDPTLVEIIARTGFDFALLDLEHGGLTLDQAIRLIRTGAGTGFPMMVRLPATRLALVDQLLDSGATGILVARVGSVGEAEAAVSAVRYPPAGGRGACPGTPANDFGELAWTDHLARAEREIVLGVALEGETAIAGADEILAVAGIDVAFVGIFDLSNSLGLPGQTDHPSVVAAVASIARTCADRGVIAGTWSPTIEAAGRWAAQGATFLPVSTDVRMWREVCRSTAGAWASVAEAAAR